MRSRLAVAALVSLMACGDDLPNAPEGRILHGRWAGPQVELIGLLAGAELMFECTYVTIDAPIRLDERGAFVARGVLVTWEARREAARLSGEMAGTTVRLTLETAAHSEPVHYTLEAGADPQFGLLPVCPL